MGMTIDYFYNLTPREFDNACFGFRRNQEMQMRTTWVQTRMVMWAALAPHQKKNTNLTPAKLMTFDWEKEEKTELETLTAEDEMAAIAESQAMWARIDKQRQQQN